MQSDGIKNYHPIDSFTGDYHFLSNFWEGDPFEWFNPRVEKLWHCKTGEHGYQADKSLSEVAQNAILEAVSPGMAKKLGRACVLDPEFDARSLATMASMLDAKFDLVKQPRITLRLIETYPARLVEGNTWGDVFWGQVNHVGQNNLGKLLEKRRAHARMEAIQAGLIKPKSIFS